jgi:mRNA-degrading endonuclease RelE of RelBE toxin-antitoxin system
MDNTKSLHDEKVESLIKKYRDEGFTVTKEPQPNEIPFDLDNYQPDILATKNENETGLIGLIIEVKTNIRPVSVERLQSVAEEVSRHPGWRFLLVTLEDIDEYYDTSTESKNQQANKNEIILDDNAQIALDALQTQEKEKISYAISCLENFPDCSEIEVSKLNSSSDNDFIAKVGIYRIIFEFQSKKVTIIDIVNYKRIEMLYGLLEKAKV